jgi:hypothetical protein
MSYYFPDLILHQTQVFPGPRSAASWPDAVVDWSCRYHYCEQAVVGDTVIDLTLDDNAHTSTHEVIDLTLDSDDAPH